MAISDGLPAIAAGNTVVHKPDSQSPLIALAGVELMRDAGFPPDVWQVVSGAGSVVGTAIIERADYICFTGSTATGSLIARQAADRLVSCSLELGGKNPMIVLPGAERREDRGRCRERLLLLRRPAVRLDRAPLRARQPLRRVPRRLRAPGQRPRPRRQPRLGRRHGLPRLAGPARDGHQARRRRRSRTAPRCSPAARPARTSDRTSTSRRCSRTSPTPPSASPVRRSARSSRCTATARSTRRSSSPTPASTASTPASGGRSAQARGHRRDDQGRHGQHQRGLLGLVRQHRRADGRHAALRPRPPSGRGGHPPLHRAAVGGRAAGLPDGRPGLPPSPRRTRRSSPSASRCSRRTPRA